MDMIRSILRADQRYYHNAIRVLINRPKSIKLNFGSLEKYINHLITEYEDVVDSRYTSRDYLITEIGRLYLYEHGSDMWMIQQLSILDEDNFRIYFDTLSHGFRNVTFFNDLLELYYGLPSNLNSKFLSYFKKQDFYSYISTSYDKFMDLIYDNYFKPYIYSELFILNTSLRLWLYLITIKMNYLRLKEEVKDLLRMPESKQKSKYLDDILNYLLTSAPYFDDVHLNNEIKNILIMIGESGYKFKSTSIYGDLTNIASKYNWIDYEYDRYDYYPYF